ncbi:MAG: amidohydrolase [Anaerovorax sp.]
MKNILKKHRRALHQIPEMGFKEIKTNAYILDILKKYSCEIIQPFPMAICAFFQCNPSKKGIPTETIAFRCDLDGLPTLEKTGLPFASTHEGYMHSCGHDGHMAMLLALAEVIDAQLDILHQNVFLLFQPAEEGGGGAERICNSGILTQYQVTKIYGIHLWPGIEKGVLASKAGPMMAKTTEMDIIIKGKSAHCASAHQGVDSLYIGCQFICEAYHMARSEISEKEYRVLKFGKAESGTIRNVISNQTIFYGTMRCFDMKVFDFMLMRLQEIAATYERNYGCTVEIKYNAGFPPVRNDPQVFEEARDLLSRSFAFQTIETPYMQAEDFSFYLERIPGLFLFLGTGHTAPLHSECFDFDEDILEIGLNAYLKLLQLPSL